MVDTVRIGGIKLSGELVQLDFRESAAPGKLLVSVLERISSAKINIPHLHQGAALDGVQTTLCVDVQDYGPLQDDIEREVAGGWWRKFPSVGTISLFPHGNDIQLVGRILDALGRGNIPVYGVSTSVSAVVLHTDYPLLDDAVEQILTVCHLPENHTPLRPVIVLGDEEIETVAVYWEPKVRIYGMEVRSGFTELQLTTPHQKHEPMEWGGHGAVPGKFRLLTQQVNDNNQAALCFLVESQDNTALTEYLKRISKSDTASLLQKHDELELVAFHGPHFQDRYGIAAMAFSELLKSGISLQRSGCTGTSIHFVVEKGRGRDVADALSETFVVP